MVQFADNDAELVETHAWRADTEQPETRPDHRLNVARVPWLVNQVRAGKTVAVPDVDALPPEADTDRDLLREQGVRSRIVAPMARENTVLGFCGLDALDEQAAWPQDTPHLLRIVSELCATVLQRQQTQSRLSAAANRFREYLEHARDIGYRLDFASGTFDYVSSSAQRLMGYTPEELTQLGIAGVLDLLHPDDASCVGAYWDRLNQPDSGPLSFEYRLRDKDGVYRSFSDMATIIRGPDGMPQALLGTVRDLAGAEPAATARGNSNPALDTAPAKQETSHCIETILVVDDE